MVNIYIGTRPEVVKLCPLVLSLRASGVSVRVVVTGQHPELGEHFKAFGVEPDVVLEKPPDGRTLAERVAWMIYHVSEVVQHDGDCTVVQGDTATVFATAVASFMFGVPVVHVEAGLRTYDLESPFPEEGFRQMVGRIATVNYAPTQQASENLVREGISPESVLVVGNTVVDAMGLVKPTWPDAISERECFGDDFFILVTCHRRENWGKNAEMLSDALDVVLERVDCCCGVVVLHPNPVASRPLRRDGDLVFVSVPPQSYPALQGLLRRADMVITDSGGIVEEATVLSKPTVIYRSATERQEAVWSGMARLLPPGDQFDDNLLKAIADAKTGVWGAQEDANTAFGVGDAAKMIAEDMQRRGLV